MSETDLAAVEFAFPGPLRDDLISAIRSGKKTSTTSLLREYEVGGEPLPAVGDRGMVMDSDEAPLFVLETIDVRVIPLGDVPLERAIDEGEGHTSVTEWRADHVRFWTSEEMRAELGADFTIDDSTLLVLERFTVERQGLAGAAGNEPGRGAVDNTFRSMPG